MSDQDNRNEGSPVPAGRHDLAPVAATNPLVLRGIGDLAKILTQQDLPPAEEPTAEVSWSDLVQLLAKAKLKLARLRASEAVHYPHLNPEIRQSIRLWTHHPSGFKINAVDLAIDSTIGKHWRYQEAGFRYREVLPKLHQLLGTTQFLWCCTVRGQFIRPTEDIDLVEWELNVPVDQILFYDAYIWEDIVRSKSNDWENLFITGKPDAGDGIHALVLLPLVPTWVKCHGQLRPQVTRKAQEIAKKAWRSFRNTDPKLRQKYPDRP
jgi:hypothetical protein